MNIRLKEIALLLTLLFAGLALAGCDNSNDVEDAADEMGDAIGNAADEMGDAADDVADGIKDATN